MSDYTFTSEATFSDKDLFPNVLNDELQKLVKDEPMFWRATPEFAWDNGGPLTRNFLAALKMGGRGWGSAKDVLIDSRVHMLMPGWYPSIPGFHFDDVPRELPNKQPNHRNPSYKSQHVMMLVGDASLTEFALGTAKFPEVGENDLYYQVWHPLVVEKIQKGILESKQATTNRLIYFDWNTWHQGVQATKRGHRLFIRATKNTTLKVQNEIRRNAQVYLENPMEGW